MSEVVQVVEAEGAKPEVDEPLREPGLKALQAERERAEAAEREKAELAARVKEFEDEKKTAEELAQERIAEAEKRAAELEARTARAEIAATSGVPVELLVGPKSASADDYQAFANALSKWRGEAPKGAVVPGEGKNPMSDSGDEGLLATARSLFSND